MSLIRSLSSPEGLYIWGGLGETYKISTGLNWKLSNIGPNDSEMYVPELVFESAAKQWHQTYGLEPVEVDGFRVENDIYIFTDTQELVPPPMSLAEALNCSRPTFWGIRISYKGLYTYLYEVTWFYAIKGFERL